MKAMPLLLIVCSVVSFALSSDVSSRELDPLLDNHDFVAACRLADRIETAELTDDQAAHALLCIGFVSGIFGAVSAPGRYELRDTSACVTGPARMNELIHRVVTNANTTPEALDQPGTEPRNIVIRAVSELFPCKSE